MSGGADVRYGIVFGEKAGVQDRVDILHAVLLRGTTVALAVCAGPPVRRRRRRLRDHP